MSGIKYTEDHEWIRLDGDTAACGISDYAQEQLGDVVYVELPEVGKALAARDQVAVVESVKAASEVYTPAGGTVTEVNDALADEPTLVNQSATGEGWFIKLKLDDASELDALMDEAAYQAYVDGLD
ncbi:MAG: glycine cleavage system protein GcvH [Alphaproteobacteria bacterium]|nr:glycine cleavage system protein GcvH [Alphaproteobacteria bacterium]